ncbi:MAG: hypothetical protein IJ466_05640 [Clostridia bacterium]|nr:hypothetical protein [Clostridia bacterium]
MNVRKHIRILSLILLTALLLAFAPAAFAEGKSATINAKTYVFQKPSSSSASMKVSKGTKVEVLGVDGQWAMIEKGGNVAFISTKYLDMEGSSAEKEEDSVSIEKFSKAIRAEVNSKTYVFKKPDADSASVKVSKGTKVDVLGTGGDWAMIEKDGNTAYIYTKYLTKIDNSAEEEPEEEKKPSMTIQEIFASGKYSNEELCYAYAVKVMGYNKAAAAGLLANIKAESGFRVNANGDSGRSYGICQWFSARKTRLLDWCESKGYDPATLYGQLEFLHYELETYYPKVDRYMKAVPDTAEGAYDAAYYFCYNFEAPANKASHSVTRGNSAQGTFYPKYESVEL